MFVERAVSGMVLDHRHDDAALVEVRPAISQQPDRGAGAEQRERDAQDERDPPSPPADEDAARRHAGP